MTKVVLETAKGLNVARQQETINAQVGRTWEKQVDLCRALAAVADEAKSLKVKTVDWAAMIKVPVEWYERGNKHLAKLLRIGRASQNDMSQYLGTLPEGTNPGILSAYSFFCALTKGKQPKVKAKKEFLFVLSVTKKGAEKLGVPSGSMKGLPDGLDGSLSVAEYYKFLQGQITAVKKMM